jgi:transcription antitermination factor NusG
MEINKEKNMLWTPVRTKPRHEKKLHHYCELNNVKSYLPLYCKAKRYGRKTVEHWLPMFPGYVFVCVDEDKYTNLLRSGAIMYRIDMNEYNEKKLIEDLCTLLQFELIAGNKELSVKPELVPGKKVTVVNGPFTGLSGIIDKRNKELLITVNIDLLGQSVSTHLDIGDVELDEI